MNENNNHNLQLKNLLDGMPGITPIEGANLYENCIVQLHRCEHPMPVNLKVGGLPAYISIIEFSTPKAVFDLKRIAI